MSTPTIAVIAALTTLYVLGAVWVWRRNRRRALVRDRIIAGAREATAHDVGPDSLRLLEDLEAHMKAYGEAVADFYDTTPGGPR